MIKINCSYMGTLPGLGVLRGCLIVWPIRQIKGDSLMITVLPKNGVEMIFPLYPKKMAMNA